MNIATFKNNTTEIFVNGNGVSATVNPWHNCEGANITIVDESTLALRMAGAFRWEELDVICVAITAARTA